MKSLKLLSLFAVVVFGASAFAQVGGNDWEHLPGNPLVTNVRAGAASYRMNYSPSTIEHSKFFGNNMVTVTYDTVYTDDTPIAFYVATFNCEARLFNFARYDINTNPAKLGQRSDFMDVPANTAGSTLMGVVCRF